MPMFQFVILVSANLAAANLLCSQKLFQISEDKKFGGTVNNNFEDVTINECAASCGTDELCVGANYNRISKTCSIKHSMDNLIDSSDIAAFQRVYENALKFDCGVLDTSRYTSGVNNIYGGQCSAFEVYCDLQTDRGGWTVIQRRESGTVSFSRTWIEYENGFGDLQTEFWLGNKYLHLLTGNTNYELRVDLDDFENQHKYAKYSIFKVAGPEDKYRLTIGGYTGDAGDSFGFCNGYMFTTKDQDNDNWAGNCGAAWGAWWHNACSECNLNGVYYQNGSHTGVTGAVIWKSFHTFYSMRKTVMMIRRVP